MVMFKDRVDAGRRLAARLRHLGGDVVVVGLPRGGVPVAAEVARALDATLDVIVVRKLGVPFQPELGMGAIGEDGIRVINPGVVGMARVTGDELAAVETRERAELVRRAGRFRAGRARCPAGPRRLAHHRRRPTRAPRHRCVIAAGAPWFMAVFGRDSLITAWMALMVDRGLAKGILHSLARRQCTDVHPPTEEEPGRILHEVRVGPTACRTLGGRSTYYGSTDATPLFVMLLGEAWRWGLGDDDLEELIPHADAAIRWITEFGDRDGDGYVEYQRATDHGLENQGWKDSWDGVPFADGQLAQTPIALCEVQGYAYGAYLARAAIADARHEEDLAERLRERARRLKEAFNRDFWLDEEQCFALALDRDKRAVDAIASNIGHCLWTGIIDDDKAAATRDHLISPQLFSGWGIRTLATSMRSYNPISYHNGSVWPHDTAICIAGLARYGYVEEAQLIAHGLLAAAGRHGGWLPELFAGLSDREITVPTAYPTSCEPQAWASAAPLLVVRSLLRFDPDVPGRSLAVAPALPPWIDHNTIHGLDVGGHLLTIRATADTCEISGAGDLRVV